MDANKAIVERALAAIRALNRNEQRLAPQPSVEVRRTAGATALAESPAAGAEGISARCGSPHCAGCYPVIHPETGETVYIHPPRPSADWLARWQKPRCEHVQ